VGLCVGPMRSSTWGGILAAGIVLLLFQFSAVLFANPQAAEDAEDRPSPPLPRARGGPLVRIRKNRSPSPFVAQERNTVARVQAATSPPEEPLEDVSDRVHAFYYPWYGAPSIDGEWQHWNHEIMPHWDQATTNRYPKGKHVPPADVGANFFPSLGPYSSLNASVVEQHFRWLKRAGVGVCVTSWYPPTASDPAQRESVEHSDSVVPLLLKTGEKIGIKIAFHLEPYAHRSALSVKRDLQYLVQTYGGSPAFYRCASRNHLPVVYVYDSYHTSARDWASILSPSGPSSIRGTDHDAIMLALWVKGDSPSSSAGIEPFVAASHFDGAYTYFAGSKFAWGSNPQNWASLRATTRRNNLMFSPSVGPGYIDTRVRPWNSQNTISRGNQGSHYDRVFEAAVNTCPEFISITSFNEWHEGTQIEPAMDMSEVRALRSRAIASGLKRAPGWDSLEGYYDYGRIGPHGYLDKTRHWVKRYSAICSR